ncbi:sensor histidine kinase [Streptomyces luteolifulvus]|uniref:histidine kinase n=1 Tax=Streptomyces luteolifulvus TaxID=2615112 RepID=A0A6H9UND8_9ACTN|nr:sensor histidine kinase [Streptomyces luteolifulvus]KAB1139030.1 sensor histidine kinase [Streptomyces luteolifulvus]
MMNRTAQPAETPVRSVPVRFHGPFVRWPRVADASLAIFMFLAATFLEDAPGDAMAVRPITDVPLPVLLLFVVAGAALYWRRRRPVAVLCVALAAWAPTLGSSYATLGGIVITALYSMGRHADDRRWGPLGVVTAVAAVTIDGLLHSVPWGEIGFGCLVMSGAWYIGRRLRLRAERNAQLRQEQAAEARRILAEERTHIARELHDVVAHRVSMMTVQAGAARMVAADDPHSALEAMTAVEEAGRQALDELRHLLGVLRPKAERDGLGPQPGLTDLPRLIEQVREAGLDVSVTDGIQTPLPARVELSVYRIVQEALTNVLKHSGPRTHTEVRLQHEKCGRGITVEVLDYGRSTAVQSVSSAAREGVGGHGIVGMRERALLLGGSLDAGPRPGGGFRLTAHLPTQGGPA